MRRKDVLGRQGEQLAAEYLEKAGFRRIGVNRGYAPGRGEEIEETILRLD